MRLFGYGSLLYEPERPDALLERLPARLPGVARRFNKPSSPRGCDVSEADWHGPLTHGDGARFRRGERYLSLALGTVPGSGIDGQVLVYRDDVADDLLARMNRREGVVVGRPQHQDHYRRVEVDVVVGRRTMRATTWVSNPGGDWHVEGLTLAREAAILRRATPKIPAASVRGARYLLGVERALAMLGVPDPYVSELADAVRELR